MNGAFDTAAIADSSTCNIFPQLTSRIGCSFQRKLFSIFKLLCVVFVRYYLSPRTAPRTVYSLLLHLDPREKISSPIQDLFY